MQVILPSLLATLLLSAGALAVPQPASSPPSPDYGIPQKQGITPNNNDINPLTTRSTPSTVGWVAAYSLNDTTCTGTQIIPQILLSEKGKCYPFITPPHSRFHIDFGSGDHDAFTQLDFYDAPHCNTRSRQMFVRAGGPEACHSVERYHGPFMSVVRKD